MSGEAPANSASAAPAASTGTLNPPLVAIPGAVQPEAGRVAFRCDESARVTEPGPLHVIAPHVTSGPRMPWRRITAPGSIGAPNVRALLRTPTSLLFAGGNGIWRSTDGGRSFSPSGRGLVRDRDGRLDTIIELERAGEALIAASAGRLYRSTDDGSTWFECDVPLTSRSEAPKTVSNFSRRLATGPNGIHLAIGHSSYISRDAGKTFVFGACAYPLVPDQIRVSGAGLYSLTIQHAGNEFRRSTDGGRTWFALDERMPLARDKDERGLSIAEAGGRIFVGTTQGDLLVSRDAGANWAREALVRGQGRGDTSVHELWPLSGGLLASSGFGLHRRSPDGVVTHTYARSVTTTRVDGADIVALGNLYLAHSSDGAQSFRETRPGGLGDDWVMSISAHGRHVGLAGSGATALVSGDAGRSWTPGPDLFGKVDVHVSESLFAFGYGNAERSILQVSSNAAGPFSPLPAPESLEPRNFSLLDADGATLLAASSGKLARSDDGGRTWQALPTSGVQQGWSGVGLIRGDAVLYGGIYGFQHSKGGGAFESAAASFPVSSGSLALEAIAREGRTTYGLVGGTLFAWEDIAHPRKLDGRLPIKQQRSPADDGESIAGFAVHREHLLVHIEGGAGRRLYLSRNRGASWQDATHGAPRLHFTALAACDAGFLLGTHGGGVWLLPDS